MTNVEEQGPRHATISQSVTRFADEAYVIPDSQDNSQETSKDKKIQCCCYKEHYRQTQWFMDFGSIIRLKIDNTDIVYLNSLALVETYLEGKKGEEFLDKHPGPGTIGEGLLYGSGPGWLRNKSAVMKVLHSIYFHHMMEEAVLAEVTLLLQKVQVKVKHSVTIDWTQYILPICSTSLLTLLVGDLATQKDIQELQSITCNLYRRKLNNCLFETTLERPCYRWLLSLLCCTRIPNYLANTRRLRQMAQRWVDSTRQTISKGVTSDGPNHKSVAGVTPGEDDFRKTQRSKCPPPNDLTEAMWFYPKATVQNQKEPVLTGLLRDPDFMDKDSDDEAVQCLCDLFLGGIFSTTSAVEFVIYFLTAHSRIQMTVQSEIESVMKSFHATLEDNVRWEMNKYMHNLWAVITEALRLGSVMPFSLPHVTKQDNVCLMNGIHIKPGTVVIGSIISLHLDPTRYNMPKEFRPSRHLDDNGKYCAPNSFRPFGIGARRCVGQSIAEVQLFLIVANILRKYAFVPTGSYHYDEPMIYMRSVRQLRNFRCTLVPRGLLKDYLAFGTNF